MKLVVLCGLPRSGKSTWARAQGLPIVNPDAIRLALHGQRFAALAEPMVWAIATIMVRALFQAGHEEVLVDATNGTRARRAAWLSKEWTTRFVCFGTPQEECIARAKATGQEDLIPVIQRMAAAWELVMDDEGPWEMAP